MSEKFYSVGEANALLPKLRPLLERVRRLAQELGQDTTTIRARAAQNGGGKGTRQVTDKAQAMERDLQLLESWQVVLRDPSIGLIDFPHQREGGTVFLCWKLDETRVEWWHPVDTGIAGRRRL